jgi:hypothetical protein
MPDFIRIVAQCAKNKVNDRRRIDERMPDCLSKLNAFQNWQPE